MVRRGSTVRVRQRASTENPCKQGCGVACLDAALSLAGTKRVHILGLAGIGGPGSTVLRGDHVESARLAEAVAVDGDRVHDAGIDGPAALAALNLERVQD